jgi:anaerobic magnesium-protoporphyrin IX monomethyl ester cyclase
MSQSDIALVFPPQWDPCYPHLALPSLKAFLDGQGYQVKQYDANVAFYDWLLSRSTLENLYDRVMEAETSADSALRNRIQFFKSVGEPLIAHTDEVKANFRSRKVANKPEELTALELGLALASLPYFPTAISFAHVSLPYSSSNLTDCFQAAHDQRVNPFRDFFLQVFIPQLLETDPDVVGISVTATTQLIPAVTLAALIREEHPHIHITLGGNTLSRFADEPERFKRLFDVIDSIILFDGEPSLEVLLDRLESGRSLEDVPNLVTFSHGKVHRSLSTVLADVNMLPTPTFEGLDLHQYFFPEPVLPLLTGRGCYWHHCAFCTHTVGYGKAYRPRTVECVIRDLTDHVKTSGVELYYFCDECIEPTWLDTLCDQMIREGLQARWMMEARLEQGFTPELCKKLYRAGCRMLAFGLESGCQRILDFMEKGITVTTASQVLKNCAEAGIWNHVFGIIGFPTETPEEAEKTLQFIVKNREHVRSAGCHTFVLERHSDVWSNPAHFRVSRMTPHDGSDLPLNFDYCVRDGMSQEKASEVVMMFQERLGEEHLDLLRFGRFLVPYISEYLRGGDNHDRY